jgi:hypothetical protein
MRSLVEAELRQSGTASPAARAELERARFAVLERMRRAVGSRSQLSVKYLPAYLDERRWRADNSGNPYVFRDAIRALLEGEGISYDRLIGAV